MGKARTGRHGRNYITAALYLADITLDEVKQKIELMESMVDKTTVNTIERIRDDPIVNKTIQNMVSSMKKSGHDFAINSKRAAKLGSLGLFGNDERTATGVWHEVGKSGRVSAGGRAISIVSMSSST